MSHSLNNSPSCRYVQRVLKMPLKARKRKRATRRSAQGQALSAAKTAVER